MAAPLEPDRSWLGIARLGLVQMALGGLTVLATSTLNRIMVVELALPAVIPGLLIGLQYILQLLRPNWGFRADRAARGGVWIVGGMALLATGVVLAACATALMLHQRVLGLGLAIIGYIGVGVGVGAAGTAVLALLAGSVSSRRRPAAATIVWLMMIVGIAATAGTAGHFLQPFSFTRLIRVVSAAAAIAMALTAAALWRNAGRAVTAAAPPPEPFAAVVGRLWADQRLRQFAIFIFVSMLAYSGQELILEPVAALVFRLPPSATAALIGLHQAGVLAGMVLVAVAGTAIGGRLGGMRPWTIGGCLASATCLAALASIGAGRVGPALRPCLFVLGIANGAFAVGAIGAMMQMAGERAHRHEAGTSMGVFGAAQAFAMGAGGLLSSGASDIARHALGAPTAAYGLVFMAEAALFVAAALIAARIFSPASTAAIHPDALGSLT